MKADIKITKTFLMNLYSIFKLTAFIVLLIGFAISDLYAQSIICPFIGNRDLGTFDCNNINDVPNPPININEAMASPYNIQIFDETSSTRIETQDSDVIFYCETNARTVTRTIIIYNDTNANLNYDNGEEIASCIFTINLVVDSTPPTFEIGGNYLSCSDYETAVPEGTIVQDGNCPIDISYDYLMFFDNVFSEGSCLGEFGLIRVWFAVDTCGNMSEFYTQEIWVSDTNGPLFTLPPNVTIPCNTDPFDTSITGEVSEAFDECTNANIPVGTVIVPFLTQENTPQPGSTTYTRRWGAIDDCGNATTMDQLIIVECDPNSEHVYPGDLNHDGIVNNQDIGLCGLNLYEIGPPRATEHQNTNWQAYPADDWNRQHLNNEDIKHFDSNGDGVIDPNDHQAVEDNFGLMWSDTIPPPPPPPQSDYQTMLLPTEQIVDGYLFLNISLERRAGGDLTMQGGYFTIDYSEITGTINFATLGLNNESWLGTRDEDLFYEFEEFPTQKKIEIGFTKTDNLNSTGSGVIGELIISYNTNQSRMNGNPIDTQKIKISTIGVHNGNDFTLLEDEIRQVYIGENSCQANWKITENTPFQNQYKSNSNITTNGFVLIGTDQEVEFNASSRVRINEGFSVKAGADFKVRVSGCD